VAHIMQPAIRDYYRLEEIWGGKSVKMKIDGAARPAVAEGGSMRAAAAGRNEPPAPKRPARKATRRAAPGTRPAPKKKAAPAKKSPAARKAGAQRAPRAR